MRNRFETAILRLLRERGENKTICPSEVARAVDPVNWRATMPQVRAEAARMAGAGVIVVLQRGRVVNVSEARGPIRLGMPASQLERQDNRRRNPPRARKMARGTLKR